MLCMLNKVMNATGMEMHALALQQANTEYFSVEGVPCTTSCGMHPAPIQRPAPNTEHTLMMCAGAVLPRPRCQRLCCVQVRPQAAARARARPQQHVGRCRLISQHTFWVVVLVLGKET